ncbi:hypothetical protein TWF694_009251 [Orbilia ellipsospora]|uniref:Transmembrane protein n=1 Tax=Orbilia ellipsospora TaxID=2528407 RepID=A0AAV9XHQ3_9PEZI
MEEKKLLQLSEEKSAENQLSEPLSTAFITNLRADLAGFKRSPAKTSRDKLLKLIGVLLWAVAYVVIAHVSYANESCDVRRDVLAYNISWEIFRAVLWNEEDHKFHHLCISVGWMGFDTFIVSAFWKFGDGTPGVSLHQQRIEFAAWFVFYSIVGFVLQKQGPEYTRVYRHFAFAWGGLLNINLSKHWFEYGKSNPYMNFLAWCLFIGNAVQVVAQLSGYSGWYNPFRHPIRFFIMTVAMIPCLILNVMLIFNSRQTLADASEAVDLPGSWNRSIELLSFP